MDRDMMKDMYIQRIRQARKRLMKRADMMLHHKEPGHSKTAGVVRDPNDTYQETVRRVLG